MSSGTSSIASALLFLALPDDSLENPLVIVLDSRSFSIRVKTEGTISDDTTYFSPSNFAVASANGFSITVR
ncbi:hypothetical protein PF005_g14669 [Phytophthora fragariae]|uniref:Uncharacterized protein n=1 Tax=Phytophthora fragariae TaxID=53985 RepID=A0A6A3XGK3_9STRA|nr:hypothetical protein PF003_g39160 [Phytophthora fragariae]KAE8933955.1 hypothetical protein PF009_g16052 [Phytophthora fragariae]KAE9017444.1 hypothetical protein PF011_g6704 [Phytophthora fragariae]KAE9120356.1 hypothetical protein PF007_g8203 [Phytophthora fragariae]KAE9120679.1 hypothetical protein PF010_g7405 [Phytophthora fragariae]